MSIVAVPPGTTWLIVRSASGAKIGRHLGFPAAGTADKDFCFEVPGRPELHHVDVISDAPPIADKGGGARATARRLPADALATSIARRVRRCAGKCPLLYYSTRRFVSHFR